MGAVSTDYINCAEGREPSMFSLTMDDLENIGVPGKKLGSMNIEDLLRGVAAGEESQSLPSSSEQEDDEKNQCAEVKKSVEDVWRDIQGSAQADASEGNFSVSEPQRTLGEMTLEEFLVKSGVVRGEGDSANRTFAGLIPSKREREDQPVAIPGSTDPRLIDRDYKRMRSNGSCAVSLPKFEDSIVPGLQGPTSPGCGGLLVPYGNGSVCVHNNPDDYVDKVAERRQRRMIKNRESAARSRARKQAYTAELEAEVMQLREENEKLKKQQVEDARWRKKALRILTTLKRTSLPKAQKLRRTNSV